MASIIVKSGYIKNNEHAENLVDYMAKKIEAQLDGGTVSSDDLKYIENIAAQPELVRANKVKIVDIIVKSGYTQDRKHAENYVNLILSKLDEKLLHLEDGTIKTIDDLKYIEYISTRPGVQLSDGGRNGLFTLTENNVDLETEKARLKEHEKSIKWSQIISLGREDAERTGFDNRQAWQNLIRAKANKIAQTYNINLKNLIVNAAYHDKDHHPHIHLVFYSTDKREGFVPDMTKASEKFKSLMFNEIFKEDVEHLKELKTEQRSELNRVLETSLKRIYSKDYSPPVKLPEMLADLSDSLKNISGKKVYGFLPPEIKDKVSDILEYMVKSDRQLNEIYKVYCDTQRGFVSRYIDDHEKIKLRMQKFEETFIHPGKYDAKTLHNIIIKYVVALDEGKPAENPTTIQKKSEEVSEAPEKISADETAANSEAESSGSNEKQSGENQTTVQKEKVKSVSAGHNNMKAAYAAVLLMRQIAYVIGKDARQDNRCYGQAKSFHVSQVRRKFVNHKRQVQRNIADDISY